MRTREGHDGGHPQARIIFREEPISAKLVATQARESAPFRAFAAYGKALGAGGLETARRLATPDNFREIDTLVMQAGGKRLVE